MTRKVLVAFIFLLALAWPVPANEVFLESPIHFQNYQELFTYIASQNGLDPETIFDLAVDSRIDYKSRQTNADPIIAVITASYLQDHKSPYGDKYRINNIRGASGNGNFYVIRFEEEGLDLIGILVGNGYSWTNINGNDALFTSWHMSAAEYVKTVYEWDGKVFRLVSSENMIEEEDK